MDSGTRAAWCQMAQQGRGPQAAVLRELPQWAHSLLSPWYVALSQVLNPHARVSSMILAASRTAVGTTGGSRGDTGLSLKSRQASPSVGPGEGALCCQSDTWTRANTGSLGREGGGGGLLQLAKGKH